MIFHALHTLKFLSHEPMENKLEAIRTYNPGDPIQGAMLQE